METETLASSQEQQADEIRYLRERQEVDNLAKQLSRPNYLQFFSVILILGLSLAGIVYISLVVPNNIQKQIENIIGGQ